MTPRTEHAAPQPSEVAEALREWGAPCVEVDGPYDDEPHVLVCARYGTDRPFAVLNVYLPKQGAAACWSHIVGARPPNLGPIVPLGPDWRATLEREAKRLAGGGA